MPVHFAFSKSFLKVVSLELRNKNPQFIKDCHMIVKASGLCGDPESIRLTPNGFVVPNQTLLFAVLKLIPFEEFKLLSFGKNVRGISYQQYKASCLPGKVFSLFPKKNSNNLAMVAHAAGTAEMDFLGVRPVYCFMYGLTEVRTYVVNPQEKFTIDLVSSSGKIDEIPANVFDLSAIKLPEYIDRSQIVIDRNHYCGSASSTVFCGVNEKFTTEIKQLG